MKSLYNLRTLLFAITVSLIAGCSGITETTLPDAEPLDIVTGQTLNQDSPEEMGNTMPTKPIIKDRENDYDNRD